MRHTNQAGVNLIKSFESCSLVCYPDEAGLATIGWGHRTDLPIGSIETQAQADVDLAVDLETAEMAVNGLVTQTLNDNQFSALVSFVFNVGSGAFHDSTLLKDLNAGNFSDVPAQIARWNHAGGKVSLGLTRRRQAEITLWGTPVMVVSDPEIGV